MSLSEAMQEVKSAVVKGEALTTALYAEVAKDFDMNPKLLERKVSEAGWTEEGLRAFALNTNPDKVFAEKVAQAVAEYRKQYNVTSAVCGTEFVWNKTRFVYIGSYSLDRHLCVREDGQGRVLNRAALENSTFAQEAGKKTAA